MIQKANQLNNTHINLKFNSIMELIKLLSNTCKVLSVIGKYIYLPNYNRLSRGFPLLHLSHQAHDKEETQT